MSSKKLMVKSSRMKPKEALSYLTGADYLKRHKGYQQRLLAENTGSNESHLPLDGDSKTATRVYSDRLRTIAEFPLVVASRVTGVDLALKKVRVLPK